MSEYSFTNVAFKRRIPDPNFSGITRHLLVVPAHALPQGIPADPNARTPNTNKQVYRDVKNSLLNNDDSEDDTFHLKNGGIKIIASNVIVKDENTCVVSLDDDLNHGIVDGGHTYEIVTQSKTNPDLPVNQYVNVDVFTGIKQEWVPDIAGGLNTSVQVQAMSLANLREKFNWIREELSHERYASKIAWSENENGPISIRDIVALLCLFNVTDHPVDEEVVSHPLYAYARKAEALKRFEENPEIYANMRPILRDILKLHDHISSEFRDIWNERVGSGAGRMKIAIQRKGNAAWTFEYLNRVGKYKLANGALYPILGAFRWFVEIDENTNEAQWRNGFDYVLKSWQQSAPALLATTLEFSQSVGYKLDAVGKSSSHWGNLLNIVAMRDLQNRVR